MKITGDSFWDELKDKAGVCCGIEDFFYGMRESAVYHKKRLFAATRVWARLKVNG